MKKTLETCSRIESYLKTPIKHLESLGQTEDVKVLEAMRQKYENAIYDHMRKNGLKKMSFQLSQNFSTEYKILFEGTKNES